MRCSPNEYISVTGVWIFYPIHCLYATSNVRGPVSSFEELLRNSQNYIYVVGKKMVLLIPDKSKKLLATQDKTHIDDNLCNFLHKFFLE